MSDEAEIGKWLNQMHNGMELVGNGYDASMFKATFDMIGEHKARIEALEAENARLLDALSWMENADPQMVEAARERFKLEGK